MNPVYKVLNRIFVTEFYRANTGFFLVILLLVFGFLKTPEHISIAGALAANSKYYLVVLGLWVLYSLKVYQFCIRSKKLPSLQFVADFGMISSINRTSITLLLQIGLSLPILGYSLFLAYMAYTTHQINSMILVLAGTTLITVIFSLFLQRLLIKPVDLSTSSRIMSWTGAIPRNLSTLFIHHLFHRLPIPFLLTKVFSLAIVIGSSALYRSTEDDHRYLSLGILLAIGVNSAIAFRHAEFKSNRLHIFENLPISKSKQFINGLLTSAFILSPEIIAMIGNNYSDVPITKLFAIGLMGICLMMLYHIIPSTKPMTMDNYTKYPFFLTAILFFVILGYVSPIIIGLIALLTAFFLFVYKYAQ